MKVNYTAFLHRCPIRMATEYFVYLIIIIILVVAGIACFRQLFVFFHNSFGSFDRKKNVRYEWAIPTQFQQRSR